jgi:hypothetical protein
VANVTITQLPAAGPITGTESVPIVQNGQTVQTTTAAIAASPNQFQTFITLNQEPTLPASRALSGSTGVGLVDGGALSSLQITLNGVSGSLESSGPGMLAKVGGTVVPRAFVASGSGLQVTDGNGIAGNPTVSLTGALLALAGLSGSGIISLVNSNSVTTSEILGTANQITVANGLGIGNPTISITTDPILPGTGAVTIPKGTTAQRPSGIDGMIRFNTETSAYETFDTTGGWSTLPSGAVTQINTGTGLTGGPITTSGTISIADTGVFANVYGFTDSVPQLTINPQGQITSANNISIQIDAFQTVSGIFPIERGGIGLDTFAAGDILYYSAGSSFSRLPIGGSNYVLTSSGSVPQWSDPTTILIGSATNIDGGAPGSLPYQSNVSITNFLPLGPQDYLLRAGAFLPEYVDPATVTIGIATVATNLQGGTAGSISYQTGVNASTFLPLGTSTYLLRAGASAPEYVDPASVTVGLATNATTSTNLAGGAAGSIPYQTASGVTAMLATSSGVLVGGTTPSYSTAPSLTGTNFTSIPNAALDNSAVTIGTTSISLGSSSLTLGGLTTVTVTQNPTNALDLATKQYVDGLVVSGIHYHAPVRVESPINLNATYNNGASGVGATLTNAGTQAALVIDGVTLSLNDRVLIYTQTDQTQNGIYYVSDVGSISTNWELTRATDADTYGLASPDTLGEGSTVFVQEGDTGAGELYLCNTVGTIVFGTTPITFVQISSAQIYSAGTGLTLTGTQFSVTTNGITDALFRQSAGLSVVGRSTNSTGNVADITAASDYQVLRRSGTSIGFGAVALDQSGAITGTLATGNGGTGLSTYTAGDLVYYATGTALSKLAIGTSTYLLTSSGTAPQWSDPAGVTVGVATNVAGGGAGQIVYNTASGTTSFITAPTVANTNLSWSGSAFTWNAAFDPASPGPIGGTTPDAGTFTTLTATGQTSLGGSAGGEGLRVLNVASTVNYLEIQGATATNGPIVTTVGTDTNIPLNFRVKGSGSFRFNTNNTLGTEQFRVAHTASAVNYVQVTGAATTAAPVISAQGSDANIVLRVASKGTQVIAFSTNYSGSGTGNTQFTVSHTANSVNNLNVSGAVTGAAPNLSTSGGDTNIDLALTPKGTGRVTTAAAIVATGGISGGTF